MPTKYRVLARLAWNEVWDGYSIAELREKNWEWGESCKKRKVSREAMEANF
jgi:hypothetical protein